MILLYDLNEMYKIHSESTYGDRYIFRYPKRLTNQMINYVLVFEARSVNNRVLGQRCFYFQLNDAICQNDQTQKT